jgi:hypothetical protein
VRGHRELLQVAPVLNYSATIELHASLAVRRRSRIAAAYFEHSLSSYLVQSGSEGSAFPLSCRKAPKRWR